MTATRNPDIKMVAIIGLMQLGAVFFGVLSAAGLKNVVPHESKELLFVLDWGWCLGIVPVIWAAATVYLHRSARLAGIARTVTVISGIAICILLYSYMLYATWDRLFCC